MEFNVFITHVLVITHVYFFDRTTLKDRIQQASDVAGTIHSSEKLQQHF